ncbi:MAG TPA: prepilin-type N-terminal cleavage/methylation domain-containing protein, partial [Burkholderiales bacterium]|nr:prepilin-type N-terminal cleavage/methylation domain-containing protein [Burkholderiales bacterium]
MKSGIGGRVKGFTLVELIVILAIVGLLAATAAPLFFSRLTYDTRAFADKAESMLRYAQKSAIAKRRRVCASLTANDLSLAFASAPGVDAACDHPLPGPSGDSQFSMDAPSG